MTRLEASGQPAWYTIHTYSGYEDRVAEALKQRIESLGMENKIFEVMVPKENTIKIKNGRRRVVERKIFPGYVLVKMAVDDDSWYVVRNTPNVTGFVGFGTTPTELSEDEFKKIQRRMGVKEPTYKIDLSLGETVTITDGAFRGMDGQVADIDEKRGRVKVLVAAFGRETPVELDFLQVKKL